MTKIKNNIEKLIELQRTINIEEVTNTQIENSILRLQIYNLKRDIIMKDETISNLEKIIFLETLFNI